VKKKNKEDKAGVYTVHLLIAELVEIKYRL